MTALSFNRDNLNHALVILVAVLLSIPIKQVGFFFLLIFPLLPLFKIRLKNAALSLPILISLNFLVTVINAVILDTLNLPVTLISIVVLTGVEAVILLSMHLRQFEFKLPSNDKKYLLLIYFLLALAIVSRVVSVMHLEVPILHDPQAHAFWAHKISKEQSIDYFYSPGLHVWSMLAGSAFGINAGRAVHLITNSFNALSVLAWALVTYLITKRARLALWAAVFILLVHIPRVLYFLSGKNSFIVSVTFLALTLLFSHYYYSSQSRLHFSFLLITLVGVGLIHYPAYAYAVGFVLIFFMWMYLRKNYSVITKNVLSHLARLTVLVLPVIVSFAFIAFNILATKHEGPEVDLVSMESATAYHDKVYASDDIPLYQSSESSLLATGATVLHNPVVAIKYMSLEYLVFIKTFLGGAGIALLGAMAVGIYFTLATKPAFKELEKFRFIFLSLFLSVIFIIMAYIFYPVANLSTIKDTGLLLTPLVLSLPLAWLFFSISERRALELTVVILIALISSFLTFFTYREQSAAALVDRHDMQTYQWINENIGDSAQFIGTAQLDPARKTVVSPADGTLWLPVFTDNQIATPFQELGFQAVKSHVNYEYIMRLNDGREEVVEQAVNYFTAHNYRYLYVDGPAAYQILGIDFLLKHDLVEVIYANEEIQVMKLKEPVD